MERESWVFMAKLAEQAERFGDMIDEMQKVARDAHNAELSAEERNLLSLAYKNVIGEKRASWRVIRSVEVREKAAADERASSRVTTFRTKVEAELAETCTSILAVLDDSLLASATSVESKVFYLKMKGDYNRYLAEIKQGGERAAAAEATLEAYKAASDIASVNLEPSDPSRLGLALNFSVFYFEILSNKPKACALAKRAFDDALEDLDSLTEEAYKDSTLIMQLLRDNLALWTRADGPSDGDVVELPEDQ